jgi:hypothetical protein
MAISIAIALGYHDGNPNIGQVLIENIKEFAILQISQQ